MSDSVAGAEKVEEGFMEAARAETASAEETTRGERNEENVGAKTAPLEIFLVKRASEENSEAKNPSADEGETTAAVDEMRGKQLLIESPKALGTGAEAPENIPTKLHSKEATTYLPALTAASSTAETTSPTTPRKPQKASFNVDAKPFSPVSLSDPTLQATLANEASGLSIKIGQWTPQPFTPIPHVSPTAPVNVGSMAYVPPTPAPAPTVKKETTAGKDSLSAYAKPWNPHPEVTVTPIVAPENEVSIHPGSWSSTTVDGKQVITPSPMMPRKSSTNLFAHSFSVHPKGLKAVELEIFNYTCGRCILRTLYGRLSSRQPDVTMRNVSVDVPPLCVAHVIEQITKAKVTALHLNESDGAHYDIWLDKPNLAAQLVELMSGCLWTTPMHHGYAVLGKTEEGKRYLRSYVDRLRDSKPAGSNVYDVALVEVKEH
ncbi:hypothetical protein JKF63_05453 [Porcisia hertigi]|uniref:Uncharacterized protein n=1 Tax=Porcisia hertigi TaxID=2761500 RepID=A0A836IYH3_9TRYP|nr:hypothetical protein JKF63_05453 [Porcisia hertigi]